MHRGLWRRRTNQIHCDNCASVRRGSKTSGNKCGPRLFDTLSCIVRLLRVLTGLKHRVTQPRVSRPGTCAAPPCISNLAATTDISAAAKHTFDVLQSRMISFDNAALFCAPRRSNRHPICLAKKCSTALLLLTELHRE